MATCKDCLHYEVCADFRRNICEIDQRRFEEYKINPDGLCDNFKNKAYFAELPCKVGDTVYYNKTEINETCPAKVVGIYNNYYTPSMPFWITIEYESELIGRQEEKIASAIFDLLCFFTRDEAEAVLKERGEARYGKDTRKTHIRGW